MDRLEVMQLVSVACLAVWCGVGGVVVPLLWQRRWRDYELLGLLLFLAVMFILQAGSFVEASFNLAHPPSYRVVEAVLIQRATSMAAAFSIIFVIWNVVKKG